MIENDWLMLLEHACIGIGGHRVKSDGENIRDWLLELPLIARALVVEDYTGDSKPRYDDGRVEDLVTPEHRHEGKQRSISAPLFMVVYVIVGIVVPPERVNHGI